VAGAALGAFGTLGAFGSLGVFGSVGVLARPGALANFALCSLATIEEPKLAAET
jgi:hypothetical protein